MEIIGKFINGILETKVIEELNVGISEEEASSRLKSLLTSGWKYIEDIDEPKRESSKEFYSVLVEPIEKEKTIGFTYVERLDKRLVQNSIERLKKELSDSDYKITKSYEATLLQAKKMPYDVQALYSERQAIRDEINRLKVMLG